MDTSTEEHVGWKTPRLKIGDSVTIEIRESEHADLATKRYPVSKDGRTRLKPKSRQKRKTTKR